MIPGSNSFNTLATLELDGQEFHYFSLEKLAAQIPATKLLTIRPLAYSSMCSTKTSRRHSC